jgi:sugar phosphate isomerase/epimerase
MNHQVNRRRFLGAAIGTGAAAAAAGSGIAPTAAFGQAGPTYRVPNNRKGIQLYTMREKMQTQSQARSVLRWLGRQGYREVETAGHYEWTARQFREELQRAGLRAPAGHDGPDFSQANWQSTYPEILEYAAELGQDYTGLAWFPGPYDQVDWSRLADNFNIAGEMAREYDLQFFYHNHDFEFSNKVNGRPAYDILLRESDRRLVKFELDLYWITEGGSSAVEYLSSDPARFFAYHVKDHVWGDRPDEADFEDVGPGMLDFPDTFRAGNPRGQLDKHYFVEHDSPWLSHPNDAQAEFATARAGINYLNTVRY